MNTSTNTFLTHRSTQCREEVQPVWEGVMGKGCVINWRQVDNTNLVVGLCLYRPAKTPSLSLYNSDNHIPACEGVPPNWLGWLLPDSYVRCCRYICSSVLCPALRLIETKGGVEEGEGRKTNRAGQDHQDGTQRGPTFPGLVNKHSFTNWSFLRNTQFMTYFFVCLFAWRFQYSSGR